MQNCSTSDLFSTPVSPQNIWIEFLDVLVSDGNGATFLSPFISQKMAEVSIRALVGKNNRLVVRGLPQDFIVGVLDCNALEQFVRAGWKVRMCNNLHSKLYQVGTEFLFGSCNLTQNGFAGPSKGNWEVAGRGHGNALEIFMFNKIWENSAEVDLSFIKEIKRWLSTMPPPEERFLEGFPATSISVSISPDFRYSLTDIPQSESLTRFYQLACDNLPLSIEERKIILHDSCLLGSKAADRLEDIAAAFLAIPLVHDFLEFVGKGKRFGELRKWLIENVADVPTPSRQDFNQQLNRLYSLVIEASKGRYERRVLGQRSEWLILL